MKTAFGLLVLLFLSFSAQLGVAESEQSEQALLLKLDGAISPASAYFITQNIEKANQEGAKLIIIQMNTPGGLDLAMRDIIRAILNSPVPVATFVHPQGSRAASAGTYILYASHVAAMAPATNLGAATPVSIGPPTSSPNKDPADKKPSIKDPIKTEKDKEGEAAPQKIQPAAEAASAMERKIINDAAAYIRSLAQLRNRNLEWAERAVRQGESLSAEEAFKNNVIDLIAQNPNDLLQKIDGRKVNLMERETSLKTANLEIVEIEPNWQIKLLSVISNPNVAYILMLLGVYGLIFEGYNPGSLLPGIAGAICLLLALYAFQILPINFVAVGLLALGIILLTVEAFVPSFGVLGIGGLIAFLFGSFMLFDKAKTGLAIAMPILIVATIVSVLFLSFVIGLALKARKRPVISGHKEMLTSIGVVIEDFEGDGRIQIRGEIWQACSSQPLVAGQRVKVKGINNLVLQVEPKE